MRIRIGILLAYLLLGCILLEDALPYFAESNTIEVCDCKTETNEKDSKKEKEMEDEWLVFKDYSAYISYGQASFLTLPGSLSANSDVIPDSATRTIFSPPPNRV